MVETLKGKASSGVITHPYVEPQGAGLLFVREVERLTKMEPYVAQLEDVFHEHGFAMHFSDLQEQLGTLIDKGIKPEEVVAKFRQFISQGDSEGLQAYIKGASAAGNAGAGNEAMYMTQQVVQKAEGAKGWVGAVVAGVGLAAGATMLFRNMVKSKPKTTVAFASEADAKVGTVQGAASQDKLWASNVQGTTPDTGRGTP